MRTLLAQGGLQETGTVAGLPTTGAGLPAIIGGVIQTLLAMLGVVFVILVIYAGFTWMTAQGNEEKVKKAKGTLTSAVIGLLIVFASYVITSYVINALATSLK